MAERTEMIRPRDFKGGHRPSKSIDELSLPSPEKIGRAPGASPAVRENTPPSTDE